MYVTMNLNLSCTITFCFLLTVRAVHDNRTYEEALNDLMKEVPVAPLPRCISKLAKLYGPGKVSPKEALGDYLGHGYDPLTMTSKFSVFDESYVNCNVTVDNKYIVPDFYKTELLKEGNRDKQTKVYSTLKEYTSSTENNIGGGGSGKGSNVQLGGSFSSSSQETKTNMEKKDMALIMISIWYKKYRLEADISTSFNRVFYQRAIDVIEKQKKGLKRMARYLVQDIYNDYGMHIVKGVILGVKLERMVYVSSSLVTASKEKTVELKGEIAGSMSKKLNAQGGLQGGKKESSKEVNEVSKIDRIDFIHVLGGPDYAALASDNYEDLVKDTNVAVLAHDTMPIYKMIHTGTFKTYANKSEELKMLRDLFQDVYNEILARNTFYGCTDKEYHNFDVQANVDDGSCVGNMCEEKKDEIKCEKNGKEAVVSKGFFKSLNMTDYQKCVESKNIVEKNGEYLQKICTIKEPNTWKSKLEGAAFYQKCTLSEMSTSFDNALANINENRTNPCDSFTDSYPRKLKKCPFKTRVLIKKYTHHFRDYTKYIECGEVTVSINLKDTAEIETYWCEPETKSDTYGLYYGGSFQRGQVNSYTRMEGCDSFLNEVKIFHDITICVTDKLPNPKDINISVTKVPVLKSIIGSNGRKTNCGPKESKELLTIIDGERMYACIFKKKGYKDVPLPKPLQLPIDDYLDMYETKSQSVITIDNTEKILTSKNLEKEYRKVCSIKKAESEEDEQESSTNSSRIINEPTPLATISVAIEAKSANNNAQNDCMSIIVIFSIINHLLVVF
uniref:Macrophage-expressed gene 1 protein n=1 Tax=Panagrellus redivivus TaxID=6233 RepID=A0A7E5A089_PANRE